MINVVNVEVFFYLVSCCLLNPAGSGGRHWDKGSTLGWVEEGDAAIVCLAIFPSVVVSCPLQIYLVPV